MSGTRRSTQWSRRVLSLTCLSLLSFAPGCINLQVLGGVPGPLVESRVFGDGRDKILLLDVDGVISEAAGSASLFRVEESTVARVREQLDHARTDGGIRAVVLRIDSPGGTATASDLVYREVLEFKRERGIPVVAQLMGTATSGGYYVAMAADRVIAHPTTVTGSIGVRFSGINLVGLMEKLGIEDQTLTAGRYKDTGSPLRRMTDVERAQIQSVLDDLHTRFKAVVASNRTKLDSDRLNGLAQGSVYSANQALSNGLVDQVGYLEDSVAEAERRAGLRSSQVITYHRSQEWKQNLYNQSRIPSKITLEMGAPLPALPTPGFLFLWMPGLP